MSEAPFDSAVAQRWFAVELNNAAWDWLEAEDYDTPGAERIVHAAHASCYHWMQVGGAANHARAACLIANVYAALGDGPSAIRHARRCIELTKANANELADWDWAFAYDVLSRSHAAAGEVKQANLMKMQARECGNRGAGNWHDLKSDT
ncbi:MAG: hypothetical protein HYV60_18435 [Planctomycetia bacterium]|nr:hypothetical protein [Planctomycetia bacterium]